MIVGLNHVALSVSDIDESIAFYRDNLGLDIVAEKAFRGGRYAEIMAFDGAEGRVALLSGNGLQIELFEFDVRRLAQATLDRSIWDRGISHFCVEVSDIDADYERLTAAGVEFHCPPLEFDGVARATYARDPDGNIFEIWMPIRRDG